MLEKTLEIPLDCKEIKTVHPKVNQSWIFIGRTDAAAKAPIILWPPGAKKWLTGKYPDAGKDWRQGETGTTEDEMVGWHHLLDGHESEQVLGVDDGQGSLVCCSPWGRKELDMTEWLNWTDPAHKGWFNITQLLTQLRYRPPAHTLLSLACYTQYPSSEKMVPGIGLLTQSSSSQYSPWHEITLPVTELLCIRHSRGALVNPANPAANPYCIFDTSASKNVCFCSLLFDEEHLQRWFSYKS